MPNKNKLTPRWQRWLYGVTVLTLVVSGFGQMPLFKRYYIADLPGLAWTGDFIITHKLHYIAAAVFLALATSWIVEYMTTWRKTHGLTVMGGVRTAIYTGIALTGLIRTPGNLPGFHWDPTFTMLLDVGHMALVMVLGVAALLSVFTSSGYLEPLEFKTERKQARQRQRRVAEMENQVRARGAKPKSSCAPSG